VDRTDEYARLTAFNYFCICARVDALFLWMSLGPPICAPPPLRNCTEINRVLASAGCLDAWALLTAATGCGENAQRLVLACI